MGGNRGEIEGHAKFPSEAHCEAKVLAGELHGEADVIGAVEDELRFGLVDEAVSRARLDDMIELGEVDPAALEAAPSLRAPNGGARTALFRRRR